MSFILALKEIFGNRRFSIFFILNMSIGLVGFSVLDSFKASFQKSTSARSRSLLTADIEISGRRVITPKELKTVQGILAPFLQAKNHHATLYSMVAGKENSRLVEIKAIEKNHPLYGHIQLQQAGKLTTDSSKSIHQHVNTAWVYSETLARLQTSLGSTVHIGGMAVRIVDVVEEDTGMSWSGGAFAPRVYVSMATLSQLNLIQKGSSVWHSHLYRLVEGANASVLATQIDEAIPDPEIKVKSHRSASNQTGILLRYLNDYLGLVAIAALFLSCLGSSFLFRGYLAKRIREIAILTSLGMTPKEAGLVVLCQLFILGICAAVISFVSSTLLLPLAPILLGNFLPNSLALSPSLHGFALLCLISLYASFAVGLPSLARLTSLKANSLFHEQAMETRQSGFKIKIDEIIYHIFAIAGAWSLAVYQSDSYYIGTIFLAGFAIAALILGVISSIGLRILDHLLSKTPHPPIFTSTSTPCTSASQDRSQKHILANLKCKFNRTDDRQPSAYGRQSIATKSLAQKLAIRQLSRNKLSSATCFLALGLGSLLLNLIPLLSGGLETEISPPQKGSIPSLFMFDIQEDQVKGLQTLVRSNGQEIAQLSPMIRARLVSVNGKNFKKMKTAAKDGVNETRENQRQRRHRNRGYNLSYRDNLSSSEEIVAGRGFSEVYSGEASNASESSNQEISSLPEISLETRFADRLGLKISDKLLFDVQGDPLEGVVVNLRRVKWTSFQPNFFIQFQPGSLAGAPATYVASVSSTPKMDVATLQNTVVEHFPNISIVDVSLIISKVLAVMTSMSQILNYMAWLTLLTGIVVIYSIAQYQAQQRSKDTALLKILGADFSSIRTSILWEFGILAVGAATAGACIAIAFSLVFSSVLFDGLWSFSWSIPLGSSLGITLLAVVTSFAATNRVLRVKPIEFLRS